MSGRNCLFRSNWKKGRKQKETWAVAKGKITSLRSTPLLLRVVRGRWGSLLWRAGRRPYWTATVSQARACCACKRSWGSRPFPISWRKRGCSRDLSRVVECHWAGRHRPALGLNRTSSAQWRYSAEGVRHPLHWIPAHFKIDFKSIQF